MSRIALRSPVAEEFLAFPAEKTAGEENAWSVISPSGDESIHRTSVPPLLHFSGKRVEQESRLRMLAVSRKSSRAVHVDGRAESTSRVPCPPHLRVIALSRSLCWIWHPPGEP